jgi:hypothetical protein
LACKEKVYDFLKRNRCKKLKDFYNKADWTLSWRTAGATEIF